MPTDSIDYDALAKQSGAVSSKPADIDYDALAKQSGAISSQPGGGFISGKQQQATLSGFGENLANSAGNYVKGIGNAVMHPIDTLKGVGNLGAGTVAKMSGTQGPTPEAAATADAMGKMLKDRYGSLAALKNTAYTDPVGFAADASTVLGGAGGLARGAAKVLPEAGRAAEVAGNIGSGLTTAAKLTNPAEAVAAANPMRYVPKRVTDQWARNRYQTILKPSTANTQAENAAIINAGLSEGIPLTKKGREKLQANIQGIDETVKEYVDKGSDEGMLVSPEAVATRTARSENKFGTQVDPNADMAAISGTKQRFLQRHSYEAPYTKIRPGTGEAEGTFVPEGEGSTRIPKPLTLAEAQAEKQGTYAQLRGKYGELSSADVEGQKDLARGLKEEVYKQIEQRYGVDLAAMGKREGQLIDLDSSIERFLNRHGNNQAFGLGPLGPAVVGHMAGGPVLGTLAAAANYFLEKNANVASRAAIAAIKRNPASRSNIPAAVNPAGRAANYLTSPEQ